MHWRGHVGAALLAYVPFGTWLSHSGFGSLALVGALGMVLLSTVPDADRFVSATSHRGLTHTVFFAVFVGVFVGGIGFIGGAVTGSGLDSPATAGLFGFFVGCFTILVHVAVDALTPMGVRPLWPLSDWHVSLALTPSKHPGANYAFLVAGLLASGSGYVVAVG